MNKIDTIIDALECAKQQNIKGVMYPAGYHMMLAQALTAARELREMKPVAWETFALKFANGQVLSYDEPKDLTSYLVCRPLYALDEDTK